jgi:hypothetical protein
MAEPGLRGATGVDRLFSFPGLRIRCLAPPPARPRCCSFRNDSNSAAIRQGLITFLEPRPTKLGGDFALVSFSTELRCILIQLPVVRLSVFVQFIE